LPQYKCGTYGITNRWTGRGQQQEMAALAGYLSSEAQGGWRLHTIQNVPVFGRWSRKLRLC
jgi:hypothetical protein